MSRSWSLLRSSWAVLWKRRWLFLGIVAIYAACNVVLVQSAAVANLGEVKQLLQGSNPDGASRLTSGVALFTVLLSATGSGRTEAGAAYQSMLLLITSLAIIWALREVMAGHAVRLRDAFYRGMYPLIPVLLVVLIIVVQLVPLAIGASIFNLAVTNGIATNGWQILLWGLLPIAGTIASVYFLTSSLFAVYIAALPDMTPLKAMRSARRLVQGRRWTILRKLLFMPFVLTVLAVLIMLPVIMFITPAAPWLFFTVSLLGLLIFHAYMYALYRELLI